MSLSAWPGRAEPAPADSQRGRVRAAESAVHEEGGRCHVARLVAGEKQGALGDLLCPRETSHRDVHQPACGLLRILCEELAQQGGVDGPRAQSIDAHPPARELDAELA